MEYRRLGKSGLKVSALSFGSWVTFGPQLYGDTAAECLQTAYDMGVNFFDNAESYSAGESERIMGATIKALGWPRHSYVISTKIFWGIHDCVNMKNTLNRKYIMQAIDGSLERLQMDFVDILFCHRADPETPVEETVFAMHDIVTSGKALYWGTSEWPRESIEEAFQVAERYNLRAPVVEQPQYNLLVRDKVEREFLPLYEAHQIGLTTWSPLASGLLTGKYQTGIPSDSRLALPGYEWLRDRINDPESMKKVDLLLEISNEIGVTLSQLAIAFCLKNQNVSTVITGASKSSQIKDNLAALEVANTLDEAVWEKVYAII
ncbi:MAG: aldo/keto reductase [Firmicutes bacterium]|jgi:voltage-dependent potassium channel beta subunit|nr:aldo/keto reductase [Bacillota bacterium]